MEFLALLTWLVLVGTGMILLPFAIATPGAGLAGLAALGGLTASILFIALGAPDWASWTRVCMALFGILAGTVAAMWLCDGQTSREPAARCYRPSYLGCSSRSTASSRSSRCSSHCTPPSRSSEPVS